MQMAEYPVENATSTALRAPSQAGHHRQESALRRGAGSASRRCRPAPPSRRSAGWTRVVGRPAEKLKVRADVPAAVEAALAASRDGGLPSRLARYITGGEVDESIPAPVAYSRSAINRFVRHVAAEIDRDPVDASVEPGAAELHVLAARPGRKLRDNRLTAELELAVRAGAGEAIVAAVHETAPEVTTAEVASHYPSYLTLDRDNFTLRLWRGTSIWPAPTP